MERGEEGHRKGLWTEEEDRVLMDYIRLHGKGRWNRVAKVTAGRVPGRTDNQVKNHWNTHLSKKLGIKRKQRTKLKAPSETLPPKGKGVENVSAPADACFELPSDNYVGTGDQKYIDDGAQSEVGYFGLEEPIIANEGYENPFWFTNDESNLSTPALTQLLDQYSLDNLFWHGL
ncbi:hypothetical protein RHGRI_034915 [Rhododendron griersonianum]|uniref:Uncharacterized protein n=1 Tax=Rhododendron griersonianum TaxID=479676 RepID=A0AAV6I2M2_9ERIC|nr:hypothetical protein RHGRI_034915 [Rhododendron griersonianum]